MHSASDGLIVESLADQRFPQSYVEAVREALVPRQLKSVSVMGQETHRGVATTNAAQKESMKDEIIDKEDARSFDHRGHRGSQRNDRTELCVSQCPLWWNRFAFFVATESQIGICADAV